MFGSCQFRGKLTAAGIFTAEADRGPEFSDRTPGNFSKEKRRGLNICHILQKGLVASEGFIKVCL